MGLAGAIGRAPGAIFAACLFGILPAGPARAEVPAADTRAPTLSAVAAETPAAWSGAEGTLEEPADPPIVRISIGAHTVAPGAARYAVRSTVAGSAASIEFATAPPPRAASGIARLPTRWPVTAARMTSGFGFRMHPLRGDWRAHAGVDLAAAAGSPVVATLDGDISVAGWAGGYGLLVAIAHEDGVQTRYAHLSRLNVVAGQKVSQGEVIGFVGSTGDSTGPHLHYEVRVNGVAVDPSAS